jgi:hypothetical protein
MRNLAQRPVVPFDVNKLHDDDVQTAMWESPAQAEHKEPAGAAAYAPPALRLPPDVSKLTSEAVMVFYGSGAKALEELGGELRDLLKRHDDMVAEAAESLKEIEETVERCREQGKLFAARITKAASMIKEIRAACADLKSKINNPG